MKLRSSISSPRGRLRCAVGLSLVLLIPCAWGAVLSTRERVIERLYPGASIRSNTLTFSGDERAAIAARSGGDFDRGVVYSYPIEVDGKTVATAYLDRHRVRTLPEILMTTVDTNGVVVSVDVLAFAEPREYLPRDAWYAQFETQALGPELRLGRQIDGVVGATLTTRATTRAVRQALAVHAVQGRRH